MKKLIYAVLGMIILIVVAYLGGCTVRTPKITGIVIDKETQQPVENAWVQVLLDIDTATPGGPVNNTSRISPAHARTGKDGTLVIPSQMIFGPPVPFGFWATPTKLIISVRTFEDKRAEMNLIKEIRKFNLKLTLPVEYSAMGEGEINNDLGHLSTYCETGRLIGEWPPVMGGCDKWEIDYIINANLRLIDRLGEPKDIRQETDLSGSLACLARLYKKKGDYRKALEYFVKVRDYDERRGVHMTLNEYEIQIKELRQKLEAK
jgi:hypothetical protein